jgi:hypothetical protein
MGEAAPAKAIEGLFDAKPPVEPGELPTVDPREAAATASTAVATQPVATATAAAPTATAAVDIDPAAPSTSAS